MADRIVMGYWDCPACGTKKIKGTLHDCPNCGRQRGNETRFYMDASNKEYLDDHNVEGADWYCEYCGALNKASLTVCENCSSPRSESKQNYFSFNKDRFGTRMSAIEASDNTRPLKEQTNSNSTVTRMSAIEASDNTRSLKEQTNSNSTVNSSNQVNFSLSNVYTSLNRYVNIKRIGLMALIPLFILILVFIFKPRNYIMQVSDVKWTNTIEVEELKTFNESDWYLPAGARLQYTRSEIRDYEQVLDHYETVTRSREVQDGGHYEYDYSDNGDGTFTEHSYFVPEYKTEYYDVQEPVYRQEPIYDTKYYYEIDRWVFGRNVVTSGSDKEPYWGDLNLSFNERESSRKTDYTIEGTIKRRGMKEKQVTYTIDKDTWLELKQPTVIEVTVVTGTVKEWRYVNNSVD